MLARPVREISAMKRVKGRCCKSPMKGGRAKAIAKKPGGTSWKPTTASTETGWRIPVEGADEPEWADNIVMALLGTFAKLKGPIHVNVWSDCAGHATEMESGKKLAEALLRKVGISVNFSLYAACDNNIKCKELIRSEYAPKHFSDDIKSRNYGEGTFECSISGVDELMPTQGVDVYGCCFPCGPWSGRGLKKGFNDAASAVLEHAIETILYMRPVFFYFENVIQLAESKTTEHVDERNNVLTDLKVIEQFIKQRLPHYDAVVIQGLSPTQAGYPVQKSRICIAGSDLDHVRAGTLGRQYGQLLQFPLQVMLLRTPLADKCFDYILRILSRLVFVYMFYTIADSKLLNKIRPRVVH